MGSPHVGLHMRKRCLVGEVDRETGRRGPLVYVIGMGDVIDAHDLEAAVGIQGLANEGTHAPAADQNDASQ